LGEDRVTGWTGATQCVPTPVCLLGQWAEVGGREDSALRTVPRVIEAARGSSRRRDDFRRKSTSPRRPRAGPAERPGLPASSTPAQAVRFGVLKTGRTRLLHSRVPEPCPICRRPFRACWRVPPLLPDRTTQSPGRRKIRLLRKPRRAVRIRKKNKPERAWRWRPAPEGLHRLRQGDVGLPGRQVGSMASENQWKPNGTKRNTLR
jgi:hypothetical protein